MYCFKKTISKWNEKEEIAKLLNLSLEEVENYRFFNFIFSVSQNGGMELLIIGSFNTRPQ